MRPSPRLFPAVIVLALFPLLAGTVLAADPVLLYSDLNWGPRTGWDNGVSKGAAVSIWGRNFGSAVSANSVNIGGVRIPATGTEFIAEWDATGIARGDRRITFWIPPSAPVGNTSITVTVNGVTSNALPFTVTEGKANIFYVSPTGNNATANGRMISTPYKDIYKAFNPCTGESHHAEGSCNPLKDGEYIVYVRAGTYTAGDPGDSSGGSFVSLYGPYGGPSKRKALVGFPGEMPLLDATGKDGIVSSNLWDPYGRLDYFTYAKLDMRGGATTSGSMNSVGYYNRIIANKHREMLAPDQSGTIFVGVANHTEILGNLFEHTGDPTNDGSMKHVIYIKTQEWGMTGIGNQGAYNTNIGFNEFANNVSSSGGGGQIFISRSSFNLSGGNTEYTDNVYIFSNYFHNGTQNPIYFGDTTPLNPNGPENFYIYNNIFGVGDYDMNEAITAYSGTKRVNIFNNTFYRTGFTQDGAISTYGGQAIVANVKNNIISATPGEPYQYRESPATQNNTNNLYQNGLFYNGASSPIPANGSGFTFAGCRIGDPLFTNASTGNFTLQSTSPAIGMGVNLYPEMSSLPMGTYDYEGKVRSASGNWDIGAIQYAAGVAPPPDTTPPAAVADLGVANTTSNSVTITWTATGNDGTTGTAASYDIRYSTAAINSGNWNTGSVVQVTGEPAPRVAGTAESITISGLLPSTTYYFAMTVSDSVPNTSPLSNVASGTTSAGTVNPPPAAPANLRIIP